VAGSRPAGAVAPAPNDGKPAGRQRPPLLSTQLRDTRSTEAPMVPITETNTLIFYLIFNNKLHNCKISFAFCVWNVRSDRK